MVKAWLKEYWIPVTVVAILLLVWAYYYFSSPKNKITFGFNSNDDVKNLLPFLEGRYTNASNERGLGVYLDVPLTAIIKNKSAKDIVLNNIAGSLSYEGQSILQTKANSANLQSVNVNAKTAKPVTDTFQVLVNGSTIKFVKDYLAGKKPKLNYNLTALVAGNLYNFKDSAVLNAAPPVSGNPSGGEGAGSGATGGRG